MGENDVIESVNERRLMWDIDKRLIGDWWKIDERLMKAKNSSNINSEYRLPILAF